jgi:hypothetical protein
MAKKSLITGDSLELLLDTMCNTFGGVMFIAIALVVISSQIPKIIVEVEDDVAEMAKIEELQLEVFQLQTQLKKQQIDRSLKEQLVEKFKNHPHLDKIQELGKLKDDNAKLVLLTSEAKSEKHAWMIAFKKAEKDNRKQKLILTQQQVALRELTDKEIVQEHKIKSKEERIAQLIKTATPEDSRTIGLTPRTATEATPFVFIMTGNKLYRCHNYTEESLFDGTKFDNSEDVKLEIATIKTPENKLIKAITINSVPGKGLFLDPKADNSFELKKLFKRIDKTKRFIWVMVNKDSFDSFVKVRDFLRKSKYKLYWYPVIDEYLLTITNEGSYEAD